MILVTDNAGNLHIKPNGKAGAVVLTMKDGKQICYEEKDGQIHVSKTPGQDAKEGRQRRWKGRGNRSRTGCGASLRKSSG
jgi:hypothetical protein